jgi:membrane protein implicated in regulation of membrane protease activity
MPLHAQILCIGGNVLFALIFFIAAGTGFSEGNSGMFATMLVFAVAAAYSVWVLVKFRRYLSAEGEIQRELRIEQLREEIDRLRANNGPE